MSYTLDVGSPSSKSSQVQQENLLQEQLLENHAKYGYNQIHIFSIILHEIHYEFFNHLVTSIHNLFVLSYSQSQKDHKI